MADPVNMKRLSKFFTMFSNAGCISLISHNHLFDTSQAETLIPDIIGKASSCLRRVEFLFSSPTGLTQDLGATVHPGCHSYIYIRQSNIDGWVLQPALLQTTYDTERQYWSNFGSNGVDDPW